MFDSVNFADTCPQRANLIEWLPFEKGQSVVIHSSAPRAVLDMLREKEVQLQVLSEAQLEKLAMNPGKGSLDYVLVLGMDVDAAFLSGLYRKVKPEGHLVVLLHNKYGMSYMAGKPTGKEQYYTAFTGEASARRSFYSFYGVEQLLEQAGIGAYTRYYLDPDDMFAVNIFSDSYLPKSGELSQKTLNFTYDRLALFDENIVLNQAAGENLYPIFANEYLVVTGNAPSKIMVRYSTDRGAAYQIKTEMLLGANGIAVRKTPMHPQGKEHLVRMTQSYGILSTQYPETVFNIVPCVWEGSYLYSPFVKGVTLAEKMKLALEKGDIDEVLHLFAKLLEKLRHGRVLDFSNYDFIFSNILIDGETWNVIDYEWTVDRYVSPEELAFRAAYCFSLEHRDFPFAEICRLLGFEQSEVQQLIETETAYQRSIHDSREALAALCEQYGGEVYDKQKILRSLELSTQDHRVQIYEDYGEGMREEQSYFVEHALTSHDEMELTLEVGEGMKALRIDPCDEPCLVQIKRLWWDGTEQYLEKQITTNGVKGKSVKNGYSEYVFATKDPNFTITLGKMAADGTGEMKIQLELHKLSLQLANTLTKSMKRII